MSTDATTPLPEVEGLELDPEEVLEWLAEHPNFLATFPEVLEQMSLPQTGSQDGTLSFQSYQIQRLQDRNRELEACFEEAQRNQSLIDHILLMAAETLEDSSETLDEALESLEKRLNQHFPSAAWAVRLFPEVPGVPEEFLLPDHAPLQRLARTVFKKGSEILDDADAVSVLWPDRDAKDESLIVSPLKRQRRHGILCRTVTAQELNDDYGFVLLIHTAACIAATLERLVPLAEESAP